MKSTLTDSDTDSLEDMEFQLVCEVRYRAKIRLR